MKVIVFINLKGGVGKTESAKNLSYVLSEKFGKRVLLIDDDKQGNATDGFNLPKNEIDTIADVLTEEHYDIFNAIYPTAYPNLFVIGANMNLLSANLQLIRDEVREQPTILRKALQRVHDRFDYCIIDNAPDINMSVINALVAADEVIVPVTIDDDSFSGLKQILVQVEEAKQFNPALQFKGCLVTKFMTNSIDAQGKEELRQKGYPVFNTHIRFSKKVREASFKKTPIVAYSPRCGPSQDYKAFAKECLGI